MITCPDWSIEAENDKNTLSLEDKAIRSRIIKLMTEERLCKLLPLRHINIRRLKDLVYRMDRIVDSIVTKNISDTNCLLLATPYVVTEMTGTKMMMSDMSNETKKGEPQWKRRIQRRILQLRQDISRLEEIRNGKPLRKKLIETLELRYKYLWKKGVTVVQEELKQRLRAKGNTVRRFEKRCKRFHDNQLFQSNQKRFYSTLKRTNTHDAEHQPNPDSRECLDFWSRIWSVQVEHNKMSSGYRK